MRYQQILFAMGKSPQPEPWLGEVKACLIPSGLYMTQATNHAEVIQYVERGELAAAVLVGDRRASDGLSLLRIIRSIDENLPCWLVADQVTPHTLQTAFLLKVISVMTQPVGAHDLAYLLRRSLIDLTDVEDTGVNSAGMNRIEVHRTYVN